MSAGSTLAYRLRPNKAVDRELFLSLLSRLCGTLPIENYQYVGLGGPFLEDFRLIHARLGVRKMKCIEMEEEAHRRQKFNCPFDSIDCLHREMNDYLAETEFDTPVILWLDYTAPGELKEQIDCFCEQLSELPLGSVVKITVNANPGALDSNDAPNSLVEYRLDKLRSRLGNYVPAAFPASHTRKAKYGQGLLSIIELAVDRHMTGYPDRQAVWALCTHYADGQPMATATVVVVDQDDSSVAQIVSGWPFCSTPCCPHVLELPALSTLERLTLEATNDSTTRLNYKLPIAVLKQDPLENFRAFYRVYPHFARVDL